MAHGIILPSASITLKDTALLTASVY